MTTQLRATRPTFPGRVNTSERARAVLDLLLRAAGPHRATRGIDLSRLRAAAAWARPPLPPSRASQPMPGQSWPMGQTVELAQSPEWGLAPATLPMLCHMWPGWNSRKLRCWANFDRDQARPSQISPIKNRTRKGHHTSSTQFITPNQRRPIERKVWPPSDQIRPTLREHAIFGQSGTSSFPRSAKVVPPTSASVVSSFRCMSQRLLGHSPSMGE